MSRARLYVGHLSYRARETDIEDLFGRYGRIREILLKNGFGFVEFDDPRDAEEAVYRCNGKDIRGERIVVELTKRPPRGRDAFHFGSSGGGGGGGGRDRDYGSSRYSSSYNSGSNYRDPPRRREDTYPTQTRYRVIVENLSSKVSWQLARNRHENDEQKSAVISLFFQMRMLKIIFLKLVTHSQKPTIVQRNIDLKDIMRSAGEVTYADAHRIKQNEGVVCYRRPEDLKRAMDTLDGKDVNGRRIKLIDGTRERSRHRCSSRF
uniref:RRM domain-containing protein n=1 Tax=Romanomermis culicivorax TaxID=13658 RepID=A0A915KWC1_ROMCU